MCPSYIQVTEAGTSGDACPCARKLNLSACCTVREVLTRVGDKWSVLVIGLLDSGTMRFMQIKQSIDGISQRMLTLTLRQLERDGLVERVVHPTVPPRVEYSLTPLGQTLRETVMALAYWAETHRADIESARHAYDNRQAELESRRLAP